jgi:acyl carrier protein
MTAHSTEHSHDTDLRKFLTSKFDRDMSEINLDASLIEELQLDSLAGLELMAEIENKFDVYFSAEHLSELRTLGNILEALDELTWRAAS